MPGTLGWFTAFSHPYEPAPPPPDAPLSPLGRQIADMLSQLREARRGSPMRQVSPPRKPRNRRRGEASISEFASAVGLGPRQMRKALHDMGLLQTEIEVRERGGEAPEYLHTSRLTPETVENGLGRRLEPRSGAPYDVLTPKGREWVSARLRLTDARKATARHGVRETVRGLLERGKTQAEIARLTGLSRQLVSHHARRLAA